MSTYDKIIYLLKDGKQTRRELSDKLDVSYLTICKQVNNLIRDKRVFQNRGRNNTLYVYLNNENRILHAKQ